MDSQPFNKYNYLFKFIMIGDTNVGKSCLLMRYTDDRFRSEHDATIGVEFGSKTILVGENTTIKIQVWDTAGQESFRSITRSYYRGSIGALLVYDITKKETFLNLQKWYEEVKQYANEYVQMIIVGNKSDLEEQQKREVSTDEGQSFARQNNFEFLETSAKSGFNVQKCFYDMADKICKQINDNKIDLSSDSCGIKVGQQNSPQQQSGALLKTIEKQDKEGQPRKYMCC